MRKGLLLLLFLAFFATACEKSKEDVLNTLNKHVESISSYKGTATLTMNTGDKPQTYQVKLWHQKPAYYKVHLENKERGQNQTILRNKDGVFIYTPSLGKSFRFQSDWPLTTSQVYLYESLIKDILIDKHVTFTETKNSYVFKTVTNYQNSTELPTQEIHLNKDDLTPKSVQVFDKDANPVIEVKFQTFAFDEKIKKGTFRMEHKKAEATMGEDVPILYPSDETLPKGVTLEEEEKVDTRTILTYTGEKPFTIMIESAIPTHKTLEASGEPVDLGHTIGHMTKTSLTWTIGGAEYLLASESLTQGEMVQIARSVGVEGK